MLAYRQDNENLDNSLDYNLELSNYEQIQEEQLEIL